MHHLARHLTTTHAALAPSSAALDRHHVALAPSRGTCITNNCIRLRLEGYLAFRRGLRLWKGSASWETCPSGIHCHPLVATTTMHHTPMMTGLTVLGTCPILIICQPLVAITPKPYKSVLTAREAQRGAAGQNRAMLLAASWPGTKNGLGSSSSGGGGSSSSSRL